MLTEVSGGGAIRPVAGGSRGIGRAMSKSTKIMIGRYNSMNVPKLTACPQRPQGVIELAGACCMVAAIE